MLVRGKKIRYLIPYDSLFMTEVNDKAVESNHDEALIQLLALQISKFTVGAKNTQFSFLFSF